MLIVVNHLRVFGAKARPAITYVNARYQHTLASVDNTINRAEKENNKSPHIYVCLSIDIERTHMSGKHRTKQQNGKNKWNYMFGVIFSLLFYGFAVSLSSAVIVLTVDLSVSFHFGAHICLLDSFECSIV